MSAHACCGVISSASRPVTRRRRGLEIARWAAPSGILAVLPKCPACIAAYFALGGGIGISLSAATYIRMGLVLLCVASLLYFAVSRGRRLIARVERTLLSAAVDFDLSILHPENLSTPQTPPIPPISLSTLPK